MSTFIHNGVEITLNESNGKFSAFINGERVTSTSLSGIKKRIDKPAEFQPFAALFIEYGDLSEVNIVRKKKARGGYRKESFVWVDDHGREYSEVIPNTQEARDAFAKWRETRERNRAEIQLLNNEIDDARFAIPSVPFG